MKVCQTCNASLNDEAQFCNSCGTPCPTGAPVPPPQYQPQQPQYQQPQYAEPAPVAVNEYDHTNEFDPQEVADNKVYAVSMYILGVWGIIIGLIATKNSEYIKFHIKQVLKFSITLSLLSLLSSALCWTILVPIAGIIMIIVIGVIQIITFFQVCSGKSKEPAIIRSLGFLK